MLQRMRFASWLPIRSAVPSKVTARASSRATGDTGRASRASSTRCARPSPIAASLQRVSRQRILVLNQYYWPGVEATAHLLTELCEALAEDYEVEVVTGVLHGHEDEPRQIEHNGVRITRVASTSYERSELGRRATQLRLVPRIRAQTRAERPRSRTSCCA